MIIYTEEKLAQQSIFTKKILNADGQEISNRKVTIPLYQVVHKDFTYFLLYDDHMKVIPEVYEYLNFELQNKPLTSRGKSAFALRLLYCFLSLSGYDIRSINEQVLSELLFFLRGIKNNPADYDSRTQRSATTVNSYLSIYRSFLGSCHIHCDALFKTLSVSVADSLEQSYSRSTDRKRYKSNLKTSTVGEDLVPRYIGPDDFRKIYSLVIVQYQKGDRIMDDEKMIRINTFLQNHGQAPETVPPARMEQFKKADTAIQARLLKIAEAKDTLKNCSINVSVIASDSGISRKTFYNNELLRLYVEDFSHNPEETAPLAEMQRLKTRTEQYKEQIDAFLIRDIETENLRHENLKLTAEITNLQTRNRNLEERYATIVAENQKLRAKLADHPGHIVPLPSSK